MTNHESGTRLQITYTLQPQDQVALVTFIERKSRPLLWAILLAFLTLPILVVVFSCLRMSEIDRMIFMWKLKRNWFSTLQLFLPILLFFPSLIWVTQKNKRQRAKAFQENDDLRQPRAIELTPENLRVVTAFSETRIYWKTMHEIGENETYIFLLTAANAGHAISKSAFGGEDEAKLFARTALSYWEKAHPTKLKAPLPDPREI